MQKIKSFLEKYSLLVLFGLICIVHGKSIYNGYAIDDTLVIQSNQAIHEGSNFLPSLLDGKFSKDTKYTQLVHSRFLSMISFAYEYEYFGENPMVSHIISILLFAILCFILFLFLKNVFLLPWQYIFCALFIFIIHPINTEIIYNIKCRDILFLSIFGMLFLYALYFFLQNGKWDLKYLLLCIISFVLMILSHPFYVIIEAIAIMYFLYFVFFLKAEKGLLKLLLVLPLFFIHSSVKAFLKPFLGPARYLDEHLFIENPFYFINIYSLKHWANAVHIFYLNVRLLLFPFPLKYFYGFGAIEEVSYPILYLMLGILTLFFLAFIVYRFYKTQPRMLLIFLSFLMVLFLVSAQIVPAPGIIAERWLTFIFCFGLLFVTSFIYSKNKLFIKYKNIGWVVFVIISSVYIIKDFNRSEDWKDIKTLILNDYKLGEPYSVASLARVSELYYNNFENKGSKTDLSKAEAVLEQAFKLDTTYYRSYMLKGKINFKKNNLNTALEYLKKCQQKAPNYCPCFLYEYEVLQAQNRESEGVEVLRKFVKEKTEWAAAYDKLIQIYISQNDTLNANYFIHECMNNALNITYQEYDLYGAYQFNQGHYQDALEIWLTAWNLGFRSEELKNKLANTCHQLKDFERESYFIKYHN